MIDKIAVLLEIAKGIAMIVLIVAACMTCMWIHGKIKGYLQSKLDERDPASLSIKKHFPENDRGDFLNKSSETVSLRTQ